MLSLNKKVSVIIPTYNASSFIKRSIEKVLNQTYKDFEIIVVDDNSTDNTIEVIKSISREIKILKNETNRGPAFSRTKGVYESNSVYVTFLDADDYWDETYLEKTVSFLEKNSSCVAVSTGYIGISLKGEKIQKPILDEEDKKYFLKDGSICPNFFDFWSKYFCVLTGTVLMRREIVLKTKGQREELRLTEDLEFWAYLSTFGEWGFIPQPLFITDPGIVTPKDRLEKMKKRYNFFKDLSINDWSKRIDSNIKTKDESYYKIINHIKTTIAVSNAYTFNFKKSYELSKLWKDDLEKGLGGLLGKASSYSYFLWPFVCLALRFREYLKSYISFFLRKS